MKKLIIFIFLSVFSLNSCYFIEQAILDEKINALRRRGAKKQGIIEKDPIIDPNPFDIREVKRKKITKIIKMKNTEETKTNNKENAE